MLKNKKGQIGTLQNLVIGLFVIGIVLGMGILVIREMASTLTTQSATVNNETIDPINDTVVYLANNQSSIVCFDNFNIVMVTNTTDGWVIEGNYTAVWGGGIKASSNNEYLDDAVSNPKWNITYTYSYGDSAECRGLDETANAIGTVPTWLVILVIVFIVGILLAVVFKFLPGSPGGGVAEI